LLPVVVGVGVGVVAAAPNEEDTLDRACDLGLAFQLGNIARDLADRIAVMVRGEVALAGTVETLDDEAVRRLLTV
jgi:hypothetical protein